MGPKKIEKCRYVTLNLISQDELTFFRIYDDLRQFFVKWLFLIINGLNRFIRLPSIGIYFDN